MIVCRLRRQDGVALTVAIFTLAVIALFSALIASTAAHLGDTSNRDRDEKRALGAAEAGINTALHRVNALGSALTHLGCLTDIQTGVQAQVMQYVTANVGVTVQAGECPGAEGRAGNGGEWVYFITLLNNEQDCDEQYTTQTQVNNLLALSVGGISVLRRCITAIGSVNGVARRLQREIYSEFRLFHGLIGSDKVEVQSGANANASHVGSNREVTMEAGTLYTGQIEVKEGATVNVNATGQWGVTYRPEPWILDPVDNSTAPNTGSVGCVLPLLLCNAWNGDPNDRKLKVDAGETVTLSGDLKLCSFELNDGMIEIIGTVRIFIEERTGCGTFSVNGGLLNTVGVAVPQNLQVYVDGATPITIKGGTLLGQANLSLYAPESAVEVKREGGLLAPIVKGSISAKTITIRGAGTSFLGDPLLDITTPFAQIAGKWHPGNWSECPRKPPAENPHEGCNG